MGNIVDSVLNVEGKTELVDQCVEALPSLIEEEDKETVYYGQSETETIRVREGRKTVSVRFETKWHSPYRMVLAAVRKYHPLGLDFHMWWHDDDGGLGPDPLFGGYSGELVISPRCFGEFYTKELCRKVFKNYFATPPTYELLGSWFSEGQGEINFLALDRETGDCEDCDLDWFRERIADADTAVQSMTEAELRAMVSEAYPERSILTEKFPKDHEVLCDGVVSRIQKLNDLIVETWGPEWFEKNNKTLGKVTEEELGGLYGMLIDEAYPEESARMRAGVEGGMQLQQSALSRPRRTNETR